MISNVFLKYLLFSFSLLPFGLALGPAIPDIIISIENAASECPLIVGGYMDVSKPNSGGLHSFHTVGFSICRTDERELPYLNLCNWGDCLDLGRNSLIEQNYYIYTYGLIYVSQEKKVMSV